MPNYRAKKIDSDEYVVGVLIPPNPDMEDGIMVYEQTPMCHETGHIDCYMETYKVDFSTLAINFPAMLDSNNKPIFASLSECGKGGDLCDIDLGKRIGVFIYHKYAMCIDINCIEVIDRHYEFDGMSPQQFQYRTTVTGVHQ